MVAQVLPFARDDEAVDVTQPPREGSAVVVHLSGDSGYDPDTNTVQVEAPDGTIEVSFGEPNPPPRESKFGDNVAEYMTDSELAAVSEKLLLGIETDEQSRQAWLENAARGISLLGLELKAQQAASTATSQTPAEATSNVDHPLLLEAVLRFQANARGELLPADGPIKVRNDGEGSELNAVLAQALEKDLNHYLTKTAKEYYPDTDRMLLLLGFSGISFKKGYHDPIKQRPVIASIDAKDLIVSNATTDLDSAGRVTHRIMMKPSTLKRMMLLGAYRDIHLPEPSYTPLKNPVDEKIGQIQGIQPVGITYEIADIDREMYECYCELDLPGFEHKTKGGKITGLPLPYKVVVDKESRKILEIRRNWEEGDPMCLPQNRIIAYIFIPGMGFYGIGLLNVLGNATKAVTAAWRLMLDAGMFANFPGFLYLKQFGKQFTNQFRVPPGSGMPIDTVGNDIRASIMPLPYKDPSTVFIQLIENIAQTAQRVGGTAELQVGEGKQDAPVGTTLALLEQATKLMSAVHKRLHSAQGQEFVLLKQLLMEDPEALWRHNKKSEVRRLMNMETPELKGIADQQEKQDTKRKQLFLAALGECDLVPAADPNTSSQTERYLKIYALRQIAMTNPDMQLSAVDKVAVQTLGFDNVDQFFKPPQPPGQQQPGPEELMAQATIQTAQSRMMDSQTRAKESQLKMGVAQQQALAQLKDLQLKDNIQRLGVAKELVIHKDSQAHDANEAQLDRSFEQQQDVRDKAAEVAKARLDAHMDAHKTALDHVAGHRDNMHELVHQGIENRHAADESALDRDHQFDLEQHKAEAAAEQAKEAAKNKPKETK